MSSFMQQFVEFFSNPQIKRESPATRGAKCGPTVFCTKKNEDSILFRSSFVFFFSHSSAWRIMKGNVMAGTCTVWPRSPFTFLIRWRLRHQNNGIRRSRTITTRFFAPHSLFRQMIFFSEMVEKRLLPWCYLRLFFNQLEGEKKTFEIKTTTAAQLLSMAHFLFQWDATVPVRESKNKQGKRIKLARRRKDDDGTLVGSLQSLFLSFFFSRTDVNHGGVSDARPFPSLLYLHLFLLPSYTDTLNCSCVRVLFASA